MSSDEVITKDLKPKRVWELRITGRRTKGPGAEAVLIARRGIAVMLSHGPVDEDMSIIVPADSKEDADVLARVHAENHGVEIMNVSNLSELVLTGGIDGQISVDRKVAG